MLKHTTLGLLAALALSGCATPEALQGDFPDTTPAQMSSSSAASPAHIRWGGTILSMENNAEGSCFEILSRPLNSYGRPTSSDQDLGRFLACDKTFREPETYKPGRMVTVVGNVTGTENRQVGEFEYAYPTVDVEYLHLWKQESQTQRTYVVDPFWPSYYPYYPYYRVYYTDPPRSEPNNPVPSAPIMSTPSSRSSMSLPSAPIRPLGK